jgi:hypothetical protein
MMVMMVICAAAASAESMLHARSVVRVSACISRRVESARLTMTMMNDDDEILKILDFGEFFNDGTLLHIAKLIGTKMAGRKMVRQDRYCGGERRQ